MCSNTAGHPIAFLYSRASKEILSWISLDAPEIEPLAECAAMTTPSQRRPPRWPSWGAILLDNAHYQEAAGRITAADFALDSHARAFRRMGELLGESRQVDIVTLAEHLQRHKELSSVGGVAWLASLTEGLPRRLSIEEYVRIVKDKSLLRQTIGRE